MSVQVLLNVPIHEVQLQKRKFHDVLNRHLQNAIPHHRQNEHHHRSAMLMVEMHELQEQHKYINNKLD